MEISNVSIQIIRQLNKYANDNIFSVNNKILLLYGFLQVRHITSKASWINEGRACAVAQNSGVRAILFRRGPGALRFRWERTLKLKEWEELE